ncbi:hypothetical protein BY996DRAFT_6505119 [Phakopsora pachyrhizi]|nr:hypothetical protein BY996DRAFT_6505119 [Phakopsora pachyrhizi]
MPKALTKRQNLAYTINKMELQSLLESDSDSKLETDILYLNHLLTKQYLGAKIDNSIDINSIIGEGRVGLDWVGLRLGWAEAKGAEIDLAININIDSEIREGRAGLSWGWAEAKGASKIPSNIDRSNIGEGRAELGQDKFRGAGLRLRGPISIAILLAISISKIGEGRQGRAGLRPRGQKSILLLILIVRSGNVGKGWARLSLKGQKTISSNINRNINSDIGKGRAGLGWAESEGAKKDINSNIASNISIDRWGWAGSEGAKTDIDSNIGIDSLRRPKQILIGRAGLGWSRLSLRGPRQISIAILGKSEVASNNIAREGEGSSPNLLPGHWHVFQKLCDSMWYIFQDTQMDLFIISELSV